MKPSDVYAMPDEGVFPWHDGWGRSLEDIFGVTDEQIDIDAAFDAGDERIIRHAKMRCYWERGYGAEVSVYTLDDRPFGIYVTSGSDDHQENHFLVTDRAAYEAALLHVQSFRRNGIAQDIADDFDLMSLGTLGCAVIAKGPEGYDLVLDSYAAHDGTLIFDPEAFADAMSDYNRKLKAEDPDAGEKEGLMLYRLADVAALVRSGIPGNLPCVIVGEWKPERGKGLPKEFTAAVTATEEGTYAVYVRADALEVSALRWDFGIDTRRLGGPELFQKYAEKHGAEATAPTP